MRSKYKASEEGKETARTEDVDLYNLMAIGKWGKERDREIGRAMGLGVS